MNWDQILAAGGVPDSPGREEAVHRARAWSKAKAEAKHKPKPKRGASSKQSRWPSLKHGAD